MVFILVINEEKSEASRTFFSFNCCVKVPNFVNSPDFRGLRGRMLKWMNNNTFAVSTLSNKMHLNIIFIDFGNKYLGRLNIHLKLVFQMIL